MTSQKFVHELREAFPGARLGQSYMIVPILVEGQKVATAEVVVMDGETVSVRRLFLFADAGELERLKAMAETASLTYRVLAGSGEDGDAI